MKRKTNQKGFTIIELVVVILLLGILTATALPRFMDVTDDAHSAVVSGVIGGLGTGVALFRAQWYVDSQPTTVVAYGSMQANSKGFPIGLKAGPYTTTLLSSVGTSTNCQEVFVNLLQPSGLPSITTLATAATLVSVVVPTSGSDFVAYLRTGNNTLLNTCNYIYTGQYTNNTLNALPVIQYNSLTGAVTLSSI
jgi:MSHA pilin protein MshB